jgi:oxaloacetate decarboxylase alpha subunit
VIRYVLGQYGPPAAPLDPDVETRVLASPRAEALAHEGHGLGLEAARARFGDAISDEELLLRMMLPEDQVDAIGGAPQVAASGPHPVRQLVAGLAARDLASVGIDAPGLRLTARRRVA